MIFATRDGMTLVVAAADPALELDVFYEKAVKSDLPSAYSQPSVTDMLLEERYEGYKRPPFVFEFPNPDMLEAFVGQFSIQVVPREVLLDKHRMMMRSFEADPYLSPDADQRPIGEIYGLEDEDPWDRRTDEQKAQDDINRKLAEENKKSGKLSGDSFGAPKKRQKKGESDVAVTDIRTTINEDGSLDIHDVLAVKGLHEDNGKGAWRPLDGQEPTATDNGGDDAAAPAKSSSAISKGSAVIPDAQPDEQFYRFRLEGFSEVDEWLDLLGDLPETAEMEIRDRMIVAEGKKTTKGVMAEWFVLRPERIAHKLSYLLDHRQIKHKVDIVNGNIEKVGKFKRDAAIAQYIAPESMIAIYHRLDVPNANLWDVVEVITLANEEHGKDLMASIVPAAGQMPDHCWLACASRLGAETLEAVLKAHPDYATAEIEVYGVNDKGERLVPKGVTIVEEGSEKEPPRPWNDRAAEWHAMDAEARKQADVKLRAKEFIFTGVYEGAASGCICYIAPRRYFNEHGKMWDQPLPINLPDDLKEVGPGIYRTRSRDYVSLCQDLARRGMIESLALQIHLNNE